MAAPQLIATEDDLNRLVKKTLESEYLHGYIEVNGFCLPEYYTEFADAIEHMEVYDDDVWVCSFPKAGTTWAQEMVWCIANDLDFESAKISLEDRFPFLEHTAMFDTRSQIDRAKEFETLPESIVNSVEYIKQLPRPRFIKTHLPFNLLPRQIQTGEKKPKIICVTRNPKDTCVSYFHFKKSIQIFRGDVDEFCRLFLAGKLYAAPFWDNVLSYWKQRERDNILFVKYEDMKSDLTSVIQKTANFLDKTLEPSGIEILKKHLSFESMKANPAVNHSKSSECYGKLMQTEITGEFMRSGQVNHGKGTMSDDVIAEFDKWTAKQLESNDLHLLFSS